MPSNAFPENPVDPVSAVDELLNWLLSTSVHCVVGIVLGLLAARAMRSRHLHWSWAAGALALVAIARPLLAASALTLAIAAYWPASAVGAGIAKTSKPARTWRR